MDVQTILNYVVVFVLPILFPVVIGAVVYLYQHLLSYLPAAQRSEVVSAVRMAVAAVEQTMSGQPGQLKRDEAIRMVTNYLSGIGVKVNPDLINMALEEAVLAVNNSQQTTLIRPAVPKSS